MILTRSVLEKPSTFLEPVRIFNLPNSYFSLTIDQGRRKDPISQRWNLDGFYFEKPIIKIPKEILSGSIKIR